MSLPNRRFVVDDTDSRIHYTGTGWVQDISGSQDGFGTYGATYNHTLHATKNNDSLTFSFQGSSIKVFGTVDLSPAYNASVIIDDPSFVPPWECLIDNISIGTSKATAYLENNWVLCENDKIQDGTHELKLNVKNIKQGVTFWVDYIQYTPSEQTTKDGDIVVVDNWDPALVYDSTWQGLDSIAQATTTSGGKVALNFTGTQLTWMGYIPISYPGNSTSASYSVDNGAPVSFDLVGYPSTDGTSKYNQIFFTTSKLAPGPHTLAVTYNGNPKLTPLTLDYIYITASASSGSSDPASSSPSSSSSGHHTPTGAIVGAVVGGVAAIAIFLCFFFLWRRKSRKPAPRALSTSGSSWVGGGPGSAISPRTQPSESEHSPNIVRPFQASHTGLLSAESLTYTQSDSIPPDVTGVVSPISSTGGGYISGAMAQVGDAKRKGMGGPAMRPQASFSTIHSHPNLDSDGGRPGQVHDEIQPPQYTA